MQLSPHEQERLMLSYAADLAWRRKDRGLKLNHPEADVRHLQGWLDREGLAGDHVWQQARPV